MCFEFLVYGRDGRWREGGGEGGGGAARPKTRKESRSAITSLPLADAICIGENGCIGVIEMGGWAGLVKSIVATCPGMARYAVSVSALIAATVAVGVKLNST